MPVPSRSVLLERARHGRPQLLARSSPAIQHIFPTESTGVDSETQLLVAGGLWKRPADLDLLDRLAAVDIVSGELSYAPAIAHDVVDHVGRVLKFEHRSLDVVLGPAHELPVRVWDPRTNRLADGFSLRTAGELGTYVGLLAGARQRGAKPRMMALPAVRTERQDLPSRLVPARALLRVVAYFCGDGWTGSADRHRTSFAAPIARKREFITTALSEIGCQWAGSGDVVATSDAQLFALLQVYGFTSKRAHEKALPGVLWELDCSLVEHVLEGLLTSDGHVTATGVTSFYTSSPVLAGQVQSLFFAIGRASRSAIIARAGEHPGLIRGRVVERKHDSYVVSARQGARVSVDRSKHRREIAYRGVLHRFSVPPFHTIVVRRSGVAVVVGDGSAHLHAEQLRAA